MNTPTSIKAGKYIGFITIILIVFLFGSCTGDQKADPVGDYSENGIALSQKTIKVFLQLNELLKNQQYQKEFIKIVNDLSPETYIMSAKTDHSDELENMYKINTLRNLESVFRAYNLQLDPNISTTEVDLRGKINAACHSLDSLTLSESLINKKEQIKKHISNAKFRIEQTIIELTTIYAELWTEESQKWFKQLSVYQEETDKGIKRIPTSAFNTEKLKDLVDEPYSNSAVLANLYKLKMVKDNQSKISSLQNQIHTVSESFGLLISIQGELMKRRGDNLKIEELNSRLKMILEQ